VSPTTHRAATTAQIDTRKRPGLRTRVVFLRIIGEHLSSAPRRLFAAPPGCPVFRDLRKVSAPIQPETCRITRIDLGLPDLRQDLLLERLIGG
jgi:hypothetical protein